MPRLARPFFRVYADILDDDRIQNLDGDHLKIFLNLQCAAAKVDRNGDTGLSTRDFELMASSVRCLESETMAGVAALVSEGLVSQRSNGGIWINGWQKDQPASSLSTKRTRKHRRKCAKRDNTADIKVNEEKKEMVKIDYPDAFEELWAAYPERKPTNPKGKAFKAWKARIREGFAIDTMAAGVGLYAVYVRAEGKEGTSFFMHTATFLGPEDPPWFSLAWDDKPQPRDVSAADFSGSGYGSAENV